jgi:hypothetical protein
VHPGQRLRIVTETARAVLDGRLDAEAGAATLALQQGQIADRLRSDRIDVTQAEADEVALTLRRLAEQVSDRTTGPGEVEHRAAIARILGELAQSLR